MYHPVTYSESSLLLFCDGRSRFHLDTPVQVTSCIHKGAEEQVRHSLQRLHISETIKKPYVSSRPHEKTSASYRRNCCVAPPIIAHLGPGFPLTYIPQLPENNDPLHPTVVLSENLLPYQPTRANAAQKVTRRTDHELLHIAVLSTRCNQHGS